MEKGKWGHYKAFYTLTSSVHSCASVFRKKGPLFHHIVAVTLKTSKVFYRFVPDDICC